MRGRGSRGPPRGPGRFQSMSPGMNRGSGRGRFPSGPGRFPSENGNGYFNNQNQSENNSAPAPVSQPEPVTEKPITPVTQSSNNVQVVTSGQTQPPPAAQQPSSAPTTQSNPPMSSSRGSFVPRGRGSFSSSRGGFVSRGRGYQGQSGPPRQQFDTRQPSNLTPASTNTFNPIKRGGPYNGPPGAKRGRYDQGPGGYAGNRSMPPQNQISSMPPQQHHQNSYNSVPP